MSIRPKHPGAPIPSVKWGPIHPASSDVSAIRQAATRWCLQGRQKIFEDPTNNPGVKTNGNLKTKSFPSWVQPVFWLWSSTRLASKVLIHAEECVGQIGGKASACMAIAMFVGWNSIACLVVGIVIFVSTIWHLFLPLGRRDTVHRDPSSNTSKIHQKRALGRILSFWAAACFQGGSVKERNNGTFGSDKLFNKGSYSSMSEAIFICQPESCRQFFWEPKTPFLFFTTLSRR